ncbi:MAG: helix-turn-helix domain-containing protein [Stenomitos frigidus ULC029]
MAVVFHLTLSADAIAKLKGWFKLETVLLKRDLCDASNRSTRNGALVRALRQELGLTQEKFVTKLGVTFPTVNQWENKQAIPSPLAMEKLEDMAKTWGDRDQELLVRFLPQ